jgi:hypothetical protein
MGQAKKKKAELESFIGSLSPSQKVVYDVSHMLLDKFINPIWLRGACYRTAFLLRAILEKEYGILNEAVVGYVNDGDNIFISHAWLETDGRKTDLMLPRPLIGVGAGPMLILDREFRQAGHVSYTYHRTKTIEAIAEEERSIASFPGGREKLRQKEREHEYCLAASRSLSGMMEVLNSVPDKYNYDRVVGILKGTASV